MTKRMITGKTLITKYQLNDAYELFQLVMNGTIHPHEAGTGRLIHSPEYEKLYSELKALEDEYAEYERLDWYSGINTFNDFYGDGMPSSPSPRSKKKGMDRRIAELKEIVRRVECGKAPEYLLCNYKVKDGQETKALQEQFAEAVYDKDEVDRTVGFTQMNKEAENFYEVVKRESKKGLSKENLKRVAERHFDNAKCRCLNMDIMKQAACNSLSKSNRREYFLKEVIQGSFELKFGVRLTGEEIKRLKNP